MIKPVTSNISDRGIELKKNAIKQSATQSKNDGKFEDESLPSLAKSLQSESTVSLQKKDKKIKTANLFRKYFLGKNYYI